jgi:leucyl/phenylalanyl-tRNA--protein transferase
LQQRRFTVTFDQAFPQVIHACAASRLVQQQQTWITPGMIEAYCVLHRLGFAHSAEAWSDERLVGGIYGVSLGSAFFGESMFKYETNASKVAFATLAQRLAEWQFAMIDCQMTNPHLLSLGAQEIPRSQFLRQLFSALSFPTRRGKWE